MKKEIDPNRFYSLYEIVQQKLIPGVISVITASNRVKSDYFGANILKAKVLKRGLKGVKYRIKGENIIKYIKSKHG